MNPGCPAPLNHCTIVNVIKGKWRSQSSLSGVAVKSGIKLSERLLGRAHHSLPESTPALSRVPQLSGLGPPLPSILTILHSRLKRPCVHTAAPPLPCSVTRANLPLCRASYLLLSHTGIVPMKTESHTPEQPCI